jgi:lysophospholipase L1-like esterase
MNRMTRRGFALATLPSLAALSSLAALPALASAVPRHARGPRLPLAAEPISRMSLRWWRERHEAKLAELRRGPVELIFLGDSITQDWEKSGPPAWEDFRPIWNRFYGGRHAVNLGFVGDATSHLLWRIDNGELAGISPKAAVILIGANNMGLVHWPVADNVTGIETVVDEVRRRLPRTRILLLGVLPSERSAWVTQSTLAINQALAARYGAGGVPDVTYMDVGGLFMRNGQLNRSLFLDPRLTPPAPPLHPTPEGMEKIAAAIEPTLSRMLGDRNRLLG